MSLRAVCVALLLLGAACDQNTVTTDPCAEAIDPTACRKDVVVGPSDPCRLIFVSEAESVFGVDLGVPGRKPGEGKCFNVADDGGLFEYAVDTAFGASRFRSAVRGLEAVGGVGRAAAWDRERRTLHLRTATSYLWVTVPDVVDPRRAATLLARRALSRMDA